MSTFIITIQDDANGIAIQANDIRNPNDNQVLANAIGSLLINHLNRYLAVHGNVHVVVNSKTRH